MKAMRKFIGDHAVRLICLDEPSVYYLEKMFGDRQVPDGTGVHDDFQITIRQGGQPNEGTDTIISRDDRGAWRFERSDYRLDILPDYLKAEIQFYDYIGLRCVMVNWYSAVIAHLNWGLVVHSSCVIHQGEAHMFAGVSGAGKTTVASLSHPKPLLSDEASIVEVFPGHQAAVYDSPMRSGLFVPSPVRCVPLRAIYLLEQSAEIRKSRISGSDALLSLFNKIWYWPHRPEHSVRVVRMCRMLAEQVPIYLLQFQKNDLFWEAIS